MSETYNGWTNRETWAFMLHINNDQGIQCEIHEKVREASVDDYGDLMEHEWARVENVAEALREWYDDVTSGDYWRDTFATETPRGVELMREDVGSKWRIDWRECAEFLLDDVSGED